MENANALMEHNIMEEAVVHHHQTIVHQVFLHQQVVHVILLADHIILTDIVPVQQTVVLIQRKQVVVVQLLSLTAVLM